MFELKKASHAVCIDIIGNRGTAELDGVGENLLNGRMQPEQLIPLKAASHAFRADTGAEEAFIGIDIAYAVQDGLVEQGSFDGKAASSEELCEVVGSNGGWFLAGTGECCIAGQFAKFKTAEAARIDKAELTAALETQAGVGMRGNFGVWRCNEQASSHAQVDDPLCCGLVQITCAGFSEFDDYMLAGAVNAKDRAAFEACRLPSRRILEWLFMRAKPGFQDLVAAQTLVDASSDSFYLR